MYKFGNNSSGNFKSSFNNSNTNTTRQIPHSRIEDEDSIYKKYELGKKLGQVSRMAYLGSQLS